MMRCDACEALLLDHLYGLLDPAEAAAVERHLSGCAACAAARDHSARVQGLFARAAKVEFPQVRFTPPVEVPAVPSTAAATPRRGSWVRWAVAASVLALIPGTLIPLGSWSAKYDHARREADAAADRLADAKAAITRARGAAVGTQRDAAARYAAAKQKTDALLAAWVAAEKDADRAGQVAVSVTKPLAVQPGAPNDFAVSVQDRANTLRGKRVEAEVRDQAGAVLFTQRIDAQKPESPLRLPAGVWAKVAPDAELFLTVAAVDEATGTRSDLLGDKVRLFGPVFATMLVTDRASYRPGERLYFRSLTLDRVTFRPPAREQVLHYALSRADGTPVPGVNAYGTTGPVRITDDRAEPVLGPDGAPLRGVGCGAFTLPADLADGDYVLTLTELPGRGGNPPAVALPVTRAVRVRAGEPEKYAKTIDYAAASFAPGELVDAWAEVKLQDKPVVGAAVAAVATVDGQPVPLVRVTPQTTGADGRARLRFVLPKDVARGDVRLKVTFRTKDGEESLASRVPVAGRDVVVEFFPEGGKLVAGVPNRVYVRATTPTGTPVDVRGAVTADGASVAKVDSPAAADQPGATRGLGSVTFTPKVGAVYRMKLDGRGDAAGYELPKAEADGVVMNVPDAVTAPGEPIRVQLHSVGKTRNLVVGAYTRGRLADTKRVAAKPGEGAEVNLTPIADGRGGVTRVTVFEEPAGGADLVPVAERLVFRKPGEVLNLSATAGAPGTVFAPGSPVELTVRATDEKGNPAAAVLWVAAVNTAATPGAKDRSLPTHLLLAGEVQTPDDLEYADFLLTDHPKAAAALDHVLATQGWRRFVEQTGPAGVVRQPVNKPRNVDAERLLAMTGQYPVVRDAAPVREHRRLFDAYWPRYEAAVKELEAARKDWGRAADRAADPALKELQTAYEAERQQAVGSFAAVSEAARPLTAARGWAGVAAGALAVVAALALVVAVARPAGWRGTLPLLVAAVGAGGLAVALWVDASRPVRLAAVPPADDGTGSAPKVDAPRPGGVPPIKVSPEAGDQLAKGPPARSEAVEPRVVSSLTSPPKFPDPGTRPPFVFPPAPGTKPIPDGLFKQAARTGHRPGAAAVAQLAAQDQQAAAKAVEYAATRTVPLADPVEAALPPAGSDAAGRVRAALPLTPPLVVREYAAPRPGATPGDAGDTVLWQPVVVLPTDGKTTLTFHTGAAPGGYQVLVGGHTLDGRIGSTRLVLPVAPAPAK